MDVKVYTRRGGIMVVESARLPRRYRAVTWFTERATFVMGAGMVAVMVPLGIAGFAPWIIWLCIASTFPATMLTLWLGLKYTEGYRDRHIAPAKLVPLATGCSADDAVWAVVHESKGGRHYAESSDKVLKFTGELLGNDKSLDGYLVVDLVSGTGVPLATWVSLADPDLIGRHQRAKVAARKSALAELRRDLARNEHRIEQYRSARTESRGSYASMMYITESIDALLYENDKLSAKITDLEGKA